MLRTALAIRHIHFEDLGTFEAVLSQRACALRYHDVGVSGLAGVDPVEPDLVVVLGGPVGVRDSDTYPFLEEERDLIRRRVACGRPLLGICLGAQQIAAALGAAVAPMGHREIGFARLALTPAGRAGPLRHLEGVPVLHWHGDAFAIPDAGVNLAATPACTTQAFAVGSTVLGLQFHAEARACDGLEEWLVGHACELAAAGIDPRVLRDDARRHGPALREAARNMFSDWLSGLATGGTE